jgi:hypothetical protein
MALVLGAARPSELEVRAAYRRWQEGQSSGRARSRPTFRHAAAGVVAFAALAAAAQGGVRLVSSRTTPVEPSPSATGIVVNGRAPSAHPVPTASTLAERRTPLPPVVESAPAPATTAGTARGAVSRAGREPDVLWQQAARALERHEHGEAERVLAELARKHPGAADAADLARAQVMITSGRATAARPLLERLAQTGTTETIRRRARQLLESR